MFSIVFMNPYEEFGKQDDSFSPQTNVQWLIHLSNIIAEKLWNFVKDNLEPMNRICTIFHRSSNYIFNFKLTF